MTPGARLLTLPEIPKFVADVSRAPGVGCVDLPGSTTPKHQRHNDKHNERARYGADSHGWTHSASGRSDQLLPSISVHDAQACAIANPGMLNLLTLPPVSWSDWVPVPPSDRALSQSRHKEADAVGAVMQRRSRV